MTRDSMRGVALKDGRFAPEAFAFLLESLDTAVELAGRGAAEGTERHVSGRELLEGMKLHAIQIFGPMAAHVWRSWGVHESLDWGRIVFLLVDEGMLNRQDSDSIDDFADDFNFDEVFVKNYVPELPRELGPEGRSA